MTDLSTEIRTNPCAKNAKEGEPVFILLGRDPDAPGAVKAWAAARAQREGMSPKVMAAFDAAMAMEKYQKGVS